jgi:hypothetical protein
MKKLHISLLLISVIFYCNSFSQNIPTVRTTEWNIAGYEGEIPCLSVLRNAVTEFGIDKTGATDVSAAVQAAINAIGKNEVLFFPNGTYLFNNVVNIPSNRVIRGESPILTIFNFNMGGDKNLFYVSGTKGADVAISAIDGHGGNKFTVASTTGIAVGDDIEIEQDNDPAIHYIESASDNVTWAQFIKGQVVKIAAINGNVITVDRTFTFDYNLAFTTRMHKTTAATNVGFENFYLKRLDPDAGVSGNNNFSFIYANNCWMRRVHSYYTARYHVRIDHSRNIEIRQCEFEMADDCAGGGAGYGVLTEIHTEDCLIEDNIFHDIRHPLISKQGASRNVYAYNYSFNIRNNATCDSDPSAPYADISLHGHYPAYNLFEGNIVCRVTSSDSWGPNGPCNTIFRNRVTTANGIWTQSYSHNQNIYANEVISPAKIFDNRDNTVTGTLLIANNVQGIVDNAPASTVENSLYLTSKPSFFGSLPWPSLGTGVAPGTGTIPAKVRWESGEAIPLTQLCSSCTIPNLGDTKSLCGASSVTLQSNVSATNRTFTWYKESTLLTGKTTKDISVSAPGTYKVIADSSGCVNTAQVVVASVLVCNLGSDFNLCNPSVKTVDAGSAEVPNVTYLWNTGETTKTIDVISAGTYSVTVSASGCPSVTDAVVATSNLLPVTGATISAPGIATLSVTGSSTYKWYSTITNGTALQTGNTYSPSVSSTTTYYVEDANGITTTLGNSAISTNGYYNTDNTVRYYFDVLRNLTVDEITVFSESAQTVVINFRDASNNLIKSVSQAVGAGEQVITTNVAIPVGTGYYVDMVGTTGRLWRDKQNGAFPYTVSGVISINQTFPTWIVTNAYYAFWYKWKITAGNSCARTPVKAIVSGSTANSQSIYLNQGWNLISTNIDATNNTVESIFTGLDVEEIKNANGFWKKGQNSALNSLKTISAGNGYLVKMNVAGTLIIAGTPVESPNLGVSTAGWNMIGCSYQTANPFSNFFNATNTQVIKNFDGFWIPNDPLSSITDLLPGKGYYIKK